MHPPHGTGFCHIRAWHPGVRKRNSQENRLSSSERESTLLADEYSLSEKERHPLFSSSEHPISGIDINTH
jgi:hypothetical protein